MLHSTLRVRRMMVHTRVPREKRLVLNLPHPDVELAGRVRAIQQRP